MSKLSGWNNLSVTQDGRVGEHAPMDRSMPRPRQPDSQRLPGGINSGVAQQGDQRGCEVGVGD
jgi:hypothetical protein